jgi:methylated-DNA-[protein]-cysteine S-methyltransferase
MWDGLLRNVMPKATPRYLVFETDLGHCAIAWGEGGVVRFQLPVGGAEAATRTLLRRIPHAKADKPPQEVAAAVAAIKRYFQGEKVDFSFIRVDLGEQDELFTHVYACARRLSWGQTTTYGVLAKQVGGGPETARDVGQAMARNPVPLIIPCHRVLAAGGKLGGFSAPGGSSTKRRMLELEGVALEPAGPMQQSLGL